ncbi:MAG: hypothetical protein IIA62_06865 [Nitrospinae bacterium]|nr:hypothetical protein [Nitrospinota bacterium]
MRKLLKVFIALAALVIASSSEAGDSPLHFIVENETFVKNIERKDVPEVEPREILEGHTPIGDIVKPYFHYQINKRASVDAGALIHLPFGLEGKVLTVDPVLAFHYRLSPTWRYTFGTIDREHPILDALIDDIRAYDDPIEQGFQLQADNKLIRQDLWIDWAIREDPITRENFTIGNYTQIKAGGFMVDGQFLWFHSGGQRNTADGVENNLSYALGTGFSLYPKKLSPSFHFLEELGFTVHYVSAKDDPSGIDPVQEEQGFLGKIFLKAFDIYFHVLIWDGGSNNFVVPRGDPIYRFEEFQEIMAAKTWWLDESVAVTVNLQVQKTPNEIFHEYLINVEWRFDVPLFKDYFKSLRKSSYSKKKAKKKSRKRSRQKR